MMTAFIANLNEVVQFRHQSVMARYQKEFPNNHLSAEKAFSELMKFFWLCRIHEIEKNHNKKNVNFNFSCSIHEEMKEIDDMWHTFLLFTKDYQEFCERYFGCFTHHTPNVETKKQDEEQFKIELSLYLNYIYDKLGEHTVKAWFSDYF